MHERMFSEEGSSGAMNFDRLVQVLRELEPLFAAAAIGVVVVTANGKVSYQNQIAAELLKDLVQQPKPAGPNERDCPLREGATPPCGGVVFRELNVDGKRVCAWEMPIGAGDSTLARVGFYWDTPGGGKADSQMELMAVLDASYDGFWVTDGQGKILYINKAYERIAGLKAEQVVGKYVSELLKEGLLTDSVTLKVIQRKERLTVHRTTRTGRKCLITGTPVFDERGNLARVIVNSRDITEVDALRTGIGKVLEDKAYKLLEKRRTSRPITEVITVSEGSDGAVVYQSSSMAQVIKTARKVARSNAPVLILGESGVGKELVARLIHQLGPRQGRPFYAVNCAAIPESLLESELIGYARGAFSGANPSGKPGLIELANRGTLLLDEIAEMPLSLQSKLLRVLETGKLMRLGDTREIEVDVRFIAATNRNITKLVEEGRFRQDLYFRLCVLPISVPPLRERREDIPLLVSYFMNVYNQKYGCSKQMAPEALEALCNYDWPGNVRELKNLLERLVVLSEGSTITLTDLPIEIVVQANTPRTATRPAAAIRPLKATVEEVEKTLLATALSNYGSTYAAARALGISQSAVMRKIKKYFGNVAAVKTAGETGSSF